MTSKVLLSPFYTGEAAPVDSFCFVLTNATFFFFFFTGMEKKNIYIILI